MSISNRIKLINCDENILRAIIKGDNSLSNTLSINIPEKWTEFGVDIFEYALREVNRKPEIKKWLVYLPVVSKTKILIGSCGFKGEPKDGKVEIGYEVAEAYRNKGYATEIVNALLELAFNERKVEEVIAQTLSNNLASIKVLKKCDFKFVKEIVNSEHEKISEFIKYI